MGCSTWCQRQRTGFDFAKRLSNPRALSETDEGAYGRGIALVNSLCEQVVYSGTGNKVWCRYVVSDLVQDQAQTL